MCVCHLLFFRVQGKVVSLPVYKELDWLHVHNWNTMFDSIRTLVIFLATKRGPVAVGNQEIYISFSYPVYSVK